MRQVRRGVLAARRRPLRCLPSAVLSSAPRGRARGEEARTRQAQVRGVPSEGAGGVNVNATDVAAVAEDALVVLVMVWWWIIVPLGWLLVLVLTPWVLAGWGFRLLRERLHRP